MFSANCVGFVAVNEKVVRGWRSTRGDARQTSCAGLGESRVLPEVCRSQNEGKLAVGLYLLVA